MRPDERDAACLWDMLQAARAVREFTEGVSLDSYKTDLKLRSAVERQLQILGDAARRVSEPLRLATPSIPWRGIVGQRNILVHDYGEIDDARVWGVAVQDVPPLLAELAQLVPEQPDQGGSGSTVR